LTEAGLLNSESINVGISEFAMVTMACGLASRGHRVVCHAVTPHFLRAWEAVRTLLVPRGYDVVLVGNGEGQEYSSLGLSHQMGEQEMRGYCLAAGIPYLLACGRKELDAGLKMRGPLFVQYKKNPSMEV
jgi:transketolase C-terminal domain/subunit